MQTPQISINISHIHPYTPTAPPDIIKTYPDNKRSQHISTDISWRQKTLSAILKQHLWGSGDVRDSLGSVCWCSLFLLTSISAWMVSGGCFGVLDCIWMVSLDVYSVRMCLRGYLGAHPLHSAEFTPFWYSPESCYFLHLATLRHQNIKMSTYILNKNGWVLPFFSFLVSVREKLKNTVTWITLYPCCKGSRQLFFRNILGFCPK